VFFFLLLPGTGGGSYTLHCPPGSAIESVTGLCRTDNPVTDRHHTVAFIYKILMISFFYLRAFYFGYFPPQKPLKKKLVDFKKKLA
jgi:hypothetical protein